MEPRTLLLDASGPSAAQYIALPLGEYELSLLQWDDRGQLQPSAYSTDGGSSWVNDFYVLILQNCKTWKGPTLFGSGGKFPDRQCASDAFGIIPWKVEKDWDGPPTQMIVYLPAGPQNGNSTGKLHLQIRPVRLG